MSDLAPAPFGCDLVEYWSSAVLWLQSNTPYDFHSLLELQNKYFPDFKTPIIMWNPPWILPILSPLGLFDFANLQ